MPSRTGGPVLNRIPANPYPPAKDVPPDFYECVVCKRQIPSKNWPEHKNSKKHRGKEDEERRAKDTENVVLASVGNGHRDGDESWDNGNAGDSPGAQDAWGTNAGNNSSGGVTRGSGGRGCHGCGEEGHLVRECPKAGAGGGRTCHNCGNPGHIKRGCPNSTGGGDGACYNCGMTGHRKADCPSGPQRRENGGGGGGGGQQCFNCYEYGHRKSDCTKERVMKCNNCDEIGHGWRDCTKPKDWSKVQCSNCKEFGHTYKRCKAPPAEDNNNNGGGWGDSDLGAGGTTGDWANADPDTTNGESSNCWSEDTGNGWGDASASGGW